MLFRSRRPARPCGPDLGPSGPIWVWAGQPELRLVLQVEATLRMQGTVATAAGLLQRGSELHGPDLGPAGPYQDWCAPWGLYGSAGPGWT